MFKNIFCQFLIFDMCLNILYHGDARARASQTWGSPGQGRTGQSGAASKCARGHDKFEELLKALWGGHTAALQFMLGILLPIGERKHAIRSRRLQEDEIMTACIATSCTEMVLICLSVGLRRNVLHELVPLQLSKSCFRGGAIF